MVVKSPKPPETCSDYYNCCDCGGSNDGKCGCNYCRSCNSCEECLSDDENAVCDMITNAKQYR